MDARLASLLTELDPPLRALVDRAIETENAERESPEGRTRSANAAGPVLVAVRIARTSALGVAASLVLAACGDPEVAAPLDTPSIEAPRATPSIGAPDVVTQVDPGPPAMPDTLRTELADCVMVGPVGGSAVGQTLWSCPEEALRLVVEDGTRVVYTLESPAPDEQTGGEVASIHLLPLTGGDRPDVLLAFVPSCEPPTDLVLLSWRDGALVRRWSDVGDYRACEGGDGAGPEEEWFPVDGRAVSEPRFELVGDRLSWRGRPATWSAEGATFVPERTAVAAWNRERDGEARRLLDAGEGDRAASYLHDETPPDLAAQVASACARAHLDAIARARVIEIDPEVYGEAYGAGPYDEARASWRLQLAVRGLRCAPGDPDLTAALAEARRDAAASSLGGAPPVAAEAPITAGPDAPTPVAPDPAVLEHSTLP